LASRGAMGGLSIATRQTVRLFLACGYEYVLVETVGVGQIELDIAQAADMVVVVLTPNAGDDVQAAKAGILEVADIFVVNKSDLSGAEVVVRNLARELELGGGESAPPIIQTSALNGEGIEELWKEISDRRADTSPVALLARRSKQRKDEIVLRAAAKLQSVLHEQIERSSSLINDKDPASAADALVENLLKEHS
jgi:LAO/AO transport system kinase